MRRAWIWGLLLGVLACAEKAPPEGVVRVEVKYGSYQPACVLVVARDEAGLEGRTDIPRARFRNTEEQMIRVAVFRKPEWGRTLTLEVSSFTGFEAEQCAGTQVETLTRQVVVPLGDYASFEDTLRATDEDGDGFPALDRSVTGLDCDDGRKDVYPGAEERCSGSVDYDCDGARGCQESNCQQSACDDGNVCTTGDKCVGSGTTAQCKGEAVVCERPAGLCVTGATCSQTTGQCETARKQCPAPASVCLDAGVCNEGTGNCEYKTKPASTSCNDSQVCTDADRCDGQGNCKGTPLTCPVSSPCFRATGTCQAAGDCGQVPEPNNVNIACTLPNNGGSGVCRLGDGACSRFPYVPKNFDPDAFSPTDSLTVACSVVFDSTNLSWTPPNCVSNPPTPVSAPNAATVLFALKSMNLNADLRLVGSRPVILAVYNSVTLNSALIVDALEASIVGAGGNSPSCSGQAGGAAGSVSPTAVGGGGGGAGGASAGGAGESGNGVGTTGGGAGSAAADNFIPLRGGCPGGAGGGTDGIGGAGGAGGGAVQLSVADLLRVNNTVTASGGGGLGGRFSTLDSGRVGGGGGGGSGGQVLLEAYRLEFTGAARLTANGGGGGEGSGYTSGTQANGANGEDGPRDSANPGKGGTGLSMAGGEGGNGGALGPPTAGTRGGDAGAGAKGSGGGGGGAAGFIRLRSVKPCTFDAATVVSPATNRQCPL